MKGKSRNCPHLNSHGATRFVTFVIWDLFYLDILLCLQEMKAGRFRFQTRLTQVVSVVMLSMANDA